MLFEVVLLVLADRRALAPALVTVFSRVAGGFLDLSAEIGFTSSGVTH